MKVDVLVSPWHNSKDFLHPMFLAARRCKTSDKTFLRDRMRIIGYDEMLRLVKYCYKQGHLGVLEHQSLTLNLEGISRVTSHQLVRYRHASFCQQSSRHVPQINDCVVPPTIEANNEAEKIYERIMGDAFEAYEKLHQLGIPLEDARYALPPGFITSLVITLNIAEMLHIIKQRTDASAQWEIRELGYQLKDILNRVLPGLLEG